MVAGALQQVEQRLVGSDAMGNCGNRPLPHCIMVQGMRGFTHDPQRTVSLGSVLHTRTATWRNHERADGIKVHEQPFWSFTDFTRPADEVFCRATMMKRHGR